MAVSYEHTGEIQNLLEKIAKTHVSEEGAISTSYIVVCEWMDSDGQYHLMTFTDEVTPAWRHVGMLQHAIEHNIYETDEAEDGDEYDG